MEYKDYYATLGVSRDAKPEEIKRSYRKLARKYHPDVSKEPNAEERFKDVQEAYEVLKDEKKRAAYNQLGSNWKSGQDFHPPPNWQGFDFGGAGGGGGFEENIGDFSDFFASIFGRAQRGRGGRQAHQTFRQRGNDEYAKIKIRLEDAYHGASRTINLQLSEYDNQGRMHPVTRALKITIPPGVVTGQQLRLAKQGSPGIGGGDPGDLYLEMEIEHHPIYTLQGRDVYVTLPITPWEAALGAKVTVPTLGGSVDMKITENAQAGQKLRLKGRGLPGKPTAGDEYVLLQIVTPQAKTAEQRALYEKMATDIPFNPRQDMYSRR